MRPLQHINNNVTGSSTGTQGSILNEQRINGSNGSTKALHDRCSTTTAPHRNIVY
jgi:hypothetical protein